jgi:hypothetical protein
MYFGTLNVEIKVEQIRKFKESKCFHLDFWCSFVSRNCGLFVDTNLKGQ